MLRSWWLAVPAAIVVGGLVLLVSMALIWTLPWWGLLSGFLLVGLIVVWCAVIYDLVQRADVPQWQKVVWAVAVILLPVFGTLAYYLTRPPAEEVRYRGDRLA